jgi:hypothetical protein
MKGGVEQRDYIVRRDIRLDIVDGSANAATARCEHAEVPLGLRRHIRRYAPGKRALVVLCRRGKGLSVSWMSGLGKRFCSLAALFRRAFRL